jgi:hypothetical protein
MPVRKGSDLGGQGSSDKEAYRFHGGHIPIMTGNVALKGTWPHIEQWPAPPLESVSAGGYFLTAGRICFNPASIMLPKAFALRRLTSSVSGWRWRTGLPRCWPPSPLKLDVRFSRIQLSRRLTYPGYKCIY